MSRGEISVGELTSLLMYTAYVGSGLQMLTYGLLATLSAAPRAHVLPQIVFRKPTFRSIATSMDSASLDIHYACCWCWDTDFRAPRQDPCHSTRYGCGNRPETHRPATIRKRRVQLPYAKRGKCARKLQPRCPSRRKRGDCVRLVSNLESQATYLGTVGRVEAASHPCIPYY